MVQNAAHPVDSGRPPFIHIALGILLLLWNGFGLAGAIAAQTGSLPQMDAASEAFFDSQPLWFVLVVDIGPAAGVAGAVALLLQSRMAVGFFAVQFAVILLGNLYELAMGTSLLLRDSAVIPSTLVFFVLLAGQYLYARRLRSRGMIY